MLYYKPVQNYDVFPILEINFVIGTCYFGSIYGWKLAPPSALLVRASLIEAQKGLDD
jgi:hypothetical protein